MLVTAALVAAALLNLSSNATYDASPQDTDTLLRLMSAKSETHAF
jgi:hypothetical protein